MLNVVTLLLEMIDEYIIWFYVLCFLVILFYLRTYSIARKSRSNTVFTLEKEVAVHNEGKALSAIGTVLVIVVVITGFRFYIMPIIDLQAFVEPTPTITLVIPTLDSVTETPSEPTPEPFTATPRPRPTPPRSARQLPCHLRRYPLPHALTPTYASRSPA